MLKELEGKVAYTKWNRIETQRKAEVAVNKETEERRKAVRQQ